jgi:hypothetical protein
MFARNRVLPTATALASSAILLLTACNGASAPTSSLRPTTASLSGGSATGGGATGGGGGGGGTTITPPPAPTSCATITSFSNSNGYYSVWAAIWTQFSYTSSCAYEVTFTMTYLNGNTGVIDFARSATLMRSGTIDEDWAAFSTPYTVTMTLTDPWGTVLASRSAVVTTKVPKTGA